MTKLALVLLSTLLLLESASAKRLEPAKVEPIIYEGVRYVAPNDDGRRGYVEAWNVATNKKLWELTIFNNRIDPNLEEDVQWIFVKLLAIHDRDLFVTSENGKTYRVDLNTKQITPSGPVSPVSPTSRRAMPDSIKNALTTGSVGKKYQLSFHIDPSFLEGDFTGDGKGDTAVLIKERSSGKVGIAIVHGATGKVMILGAGIPIGNGGDDFEWMDSWQVYSKTRARGDAKESSIQHFRGDALLVEKKDAASAFIYWNGKKYIWSQQGD
jgi:hypothetical protein